MGKWHQPNGQFTESQNPTEVSIIACVSCVVYMVSWCAHHATPGYVRQVVVYSPCACGPSCHQGACVRVRLLACVCACPAFLVDLRTTQQTWKSISCMLVFPHLFSFLYHHGAIYTVYVNSTFLFLSFLLIFLVEMAQWITLLGTVSTENQIWEIIERFHLKENELQYSVEHILKVAVYSWR